MDIDTYNKAIQLIELIANSIHERNPGNNTNMTYFTSQEVQLVQLWIKTFIQEICG